MFLFYSVAVISYLTKHKRVSLPAFSLIRETFLMLHLIYFLDFHYEFWCKNVGELIGECCNILYVDDFKIFLLLHLAAR